MRISDPALSNPAKPVIWAHIDSWAASEIIQPVIKLFARQRRHTILMTFPSSLSAKHDFLRNYNYIDCLSPLPADTESDAESFISSTKPSAVIFAMSDCCVNFLHQLKKRDIPTFLISERIRKPLPFLKWRDSLWREAMKTFTHIFVFGDESKAFLAKLGSAGQSNITVGELPPIDNEVLPEDKKHLHDPIIERFTAGERFVFIGGEIDTDKDLRLVAHLANANPALKCILVPHTISKERLDKIKYELEGFTILYSECDENTDFDKVQILVIDFIGDLSRIYHYGSCAYIGGGFTPDLHNVIEATANGLPTSFGPRIRHRILPKHLISLGLSQIVEKPDDILKWEKNLESDPDSVNRINSDSMRFVERSVETTHRIYSCINSYL